MFGYDISGNKATNVGEYTAKVTGKGNFTGEATAVYTIVKDDTPETLNIDIEVSDAETGEESKVNAKMNVTVDPKGEITQREIIVIDEATGEKVKKTARRLCPDANAEGQLRSREDFGHHNAS